LFEDNIPGVPGIGPKTAASLINEFGSLDELLLNLGSIKQKGRREKLEENRASLDISRRLVKLETTIPIKNMTLHHDFSSVNDLRMEPRTLENEERLLQFYSDMGLRDIARRVKGRLYQDQWSTVPTTTRGPSDNTISVKESIVNSHTTDDNTLLNKISFLSPRPKSPPGPMEYDDVPF
jgi:5'-3' exonuclease